MTQADTRDLLVADVQHVLGVVRSAKQNAESSTGWEFEAGQFDAAESLLIGIESHLHSLEVDD